MASQASEQKVQQLYIAYFGRPADPAGLAFYADALDAQTTTVEDIATSFGDSAEAQQLINNLTTEEFIEALYLQAFGRAYDEAADGTFWIDAIDNGETTKELAFIQILEGAQGDDIDAVNNKVEVAQTFTANVDAAAYQGQEAVDAAAELLANVTADPATVDNQEAIDVAEDVNNGTVGQPNFTLNSPGAVTEGEAAVFTLVADEAVQEDTTVTFQLIANGQTDTNTTEASTPDFAVGSFTEVTVTIPAGQTTAEFDVQTVIDQFVEQTENYSVVATVNGEEFTANGSINEDGLPEQDIILTAGADLVTPDSGVAGFQTTAGDDSIFAGSVQGGGAHTLGAADIIDGGEGNDTLTIIEDRQPGSTSTLFPNMQNVENVRIQALEDTELDLTNTNGVEQIVNDRSTDTINIDNLNDDVDFVFTDTIGAMNVEYANNANLDNEVNVVFNNSNGASLDLNNSDDVDTLNAEFNGEDTTVDANTFTGLNGTANLTNLNLSGTSNLAFIPALGAGVFNDLTNVDASMVEGNLSINLVDNIENVTFTGAQGDNSLVSGSGNNDITFQDGDDLLVLSSDGFDANDTTDFAGGDDTLEIHFKETVSAADLDNAANGNIDAINNTMNGETLVIDVWNQVTEDVTLDAGLIDSFNNFVFDDTFEDGNVNGANIQDADIEGTVTVTNVADTDTFTFRTDYNETANFTAAQGATALNLNLAGSDAANEGLDIDAISSIDAQGFSEVNLNIENANGAADIGLANGMLVDSGSTSQFTGNVGNDDGVNGNLFVNLDVRDADNGVTTFDFSGLNTGADTVLSGPNLITVVNDNVGENVEIIGTAQDDTITASANNDVVDGGAGNDIIIGGAGDDTLNGGDGDDIIRAGAGVETLSGGNGDDVFEFDAAELTSADTINGDEGNDTVALTGAATLNDSIFNRWDSVENLQLDDVASSVILNAIANDAGLESVIGGSDDDVITVGEGFDNDLTIDLSAGGDDTVDAEEATGAMTVLAGAAEITGTDNIVLGTSANDVIRLTADNGTADLSAVSSTETVELVSDENNLGADIDVTIVDSTFDGIGGTLVVDATGLVNAELDTTDATIDASAVTVGNVEVTGGEGNDTILATANDDVIDGGAGDDAITGGDGVDTLTGGEGNDTFFYLDVSNSFGSSTDTITDFMVGEDVINVFEALMTPGDTLNFAGNQADFGSAQGATTAADTSGAGNLIDYVYQQNNNTLWVDINNDGTLNADDLQIQLQGVDAIDNGSVVA